MEELLNCVLEICCATPEQQHAALTRFLVEYCGTPQPHAEKAATELQEHFDFAEKGTLKPFKDSVARLARGNPFV